MEIKREKVVDEIIGDMKTNKFKIGEDSMGIIIDSLINLYSDPVGSIIREVTSNCYDAHREKRLKREGIIPSTSEDDSKYWHPDSKNVEIEFQEENVLLGIGNAMIFRDFGIGLSQDRVETIYTMFGNSTKRDNNLQIGGFGIGAKSPFSYTNTFYIMANHNGTHYSYMLYKGNEAFHMDMIKATPTTELNSTQVIIPIKSDEDNRKFSKAIKNQLVYFDNVVYTNVEEGLGCNIVKAYPEYENDHMAITIGEDRVSEYTHCMIGRVKYDLDYKALEIDKLYASMAIKFGVGELDLVPSREAIRYTDRTKKAILAKIELVKQECVTDCNHDINTAEDFLAWIKLAMTISRTKKNYWNHNDSDFGSVFAVKANFSDILRKDLKLDLVGELSVNPLIDEAIEKIFAGFTINTVARVSDSKYSGGYKISKVVTKWEDFLKYDIYYQEQPNDGSPQKTFRKAKDMFILNQQQDLGRGHNKYIQLRRNSIDDSVISREKQITLFRHDDLGIRTEETIRKDFDIMSTLLNACKPKFKMYDDVEIKGVSEEDLELMGNYESDQQRRARLGKLFCRKLYVERGVSVPVKFGNMEITGLEMGEYKDKGGIIVYGYSKDSGLMKMLGAICSDGEAGLNKRASTYVSNNLHFSPGEERRNHESVVILKVANSIKDELSEYIYIEDLFKMKHDIVKNWYTAHLIHRRVEAVNFFQVFKNLNDDLYYKWKKLHKLHIEYYDQYSLLTLVEKKALVELCKENDVVNHKCLEVLETLEEYATGLEIFKNLTQVQEREANNSIKKKELFLELRTYLRHKDKPTVKFKKINKNKKIKNGK